MTIRLLTGDCRDVLATLPACSVHTVVTSPPYYGLRDYGTAQWEGGDAACEHIAPPDGGRGNTHAYSDAHFATFPPALVERCIRAGTSERGCCAACGAPWVRVIDAETRPNWKGDGQKHDGTYYRPNIGGGVANDARAKIDRGWRASCHCDAEVVPCTVLDPFVGSGTTALVADRLQRHAIGIDLSIDYAAMAQRRLEDDCPLFTAWAPAETDAQDERMRDLFSVAAD